MAAGDSEIPASYQSEEAHNCSRYEGELKEGADEDTIGENASQGTEDLKYANIHRSIFTAYKDI